MITTEMLKTEIDKVRQEYLEILSQVIKAFESSAENLNTDIQKLKEEKHTGWHEFLKDSFGCLANDLIERGEQGLFEKRETMA